MPTAKPIQREYVFSNSYFENQFNKCPDVISSFVDFNDENIDTIIDFGCGHGIKTLSMALSNPGKTVIGVDITTAFNKAKEFSMSQLKMNLPDNLYFRKIEPGQSLKSVSVASVICSWSVLEHVQQCILASVIHDMYESLSPNGLVFTQIAPLYYSPYGSHLREYIDQPWAHLILDQDKFKEIVENGSGELPENIDKNKRKWMFENYTKLNKLSADELRGYFIDAGFVFADEKLIKTNIKPSASLLSVYNENVLTNNELIFVNKKC